MLRIETDVKWLNYAASTISRQAPFPSGRLDSSSLENADLNPAYQKVPHQRESDKLKKTIVADDHHRRIKKPWRCRQEDDDSQSGQKDK